MYICKVYCSALILWKQMCLTGVWICPLLVSQLKYRQSKYTFAFLLKQIYQISVTATTGCAANQFLGWLFSPTCPATFGLLSVNCIVPVSEWDVLRRDQPRLDCQWRLIQHVIHSDVSPWPWSLRPKSLSLALALMHQVLGLGLEGGPWPWPWMLGMTLYLTQVTSDKNSLLHWCDGVCWQWQYVLAHGNVIIYLPSQQCF